MPLCRCRSFAVFVCKYKRFTAGGDVSKFGDNYGGFSVRCRTERGDTAQLRHRYSRFNGLPKPTDSRQLSKSQRKEERVGRARKKARATLVQVNDTRSQAIYQVLFDAGQGY